MSLLGGTTPDLANRWASNARRSCLRRVISISGSITQRFLRLVVETASLIYDTART